MFTPCSFIISSIRLICLITVSWLDVESGDGGVSGSVFCVCVSIVPYSWLMIVVLLQYLFLTLCEESPGCMYMGSYLGSLFCCRVVYVFCFYLFHWLMSVPCNSGWYSSAVSLEIRFCDTSCFVPIDYDCFIDQIFLSLCINFGIEFCDEYHWFFDEDFPDSVDCQCWFI